MTRREANSPRQSSPWMNPWYAAKGGGWPVTLAHKLKRESNSAASAAITRCRKASTAVSGWEIGPATGSSARSEEHTSELQSRLHLVCRLLLEKKKKPKYSDGATYKRDKYSGALGRCWRNFVYTPH